MLENVRNESCENLQNSLYMAYRTNKTATTTTLTTQRADFENGLRQINEHRAIKCEEKLKQKIGDEGECPRGMAKSLFSDCRAQTHSEEAVRQANMPSFTLRFSVYSLRIAFPLRKF